MPKARTKFIKSELNALQITVGALAFQTAEIAQALAKIQGQLTAIRDAAPANLPLTKAADVPLKFYRSGQI